MVVEMVDAIYGDISMHCQEEKEDAINSLQEELAILKRQLADQENDRLKTLQKDNDFMSSIHRQFTVMQSTNATGLEEGLSKMNAKYLSDMKSALSVIKNDDELKVASDKRVQERESQVFWTIWLLPETR
jgi:hypothetical protein